MSSTEDVNVTDESSSLSAAPEYIVCDRRRRGTDPEVGDIHSLVLRFNVQNIKYRPTRESRNRRVGGYFRISQRIN